MVDNIHGLQLKLLITKVVKFRTTRSYYQVKVGTKFENSLKILKFHRK